MRQLKQCSQFHAFRNAFILWARALCKSTAGKLVAIDGKTVRGTFAGPEGAGALHLINARVSENAVMLGQCDRKLAGTAQPAFSCWRQSENALLADNRRPGASEKRLDLTPGPGGVCLQQQVRAVNFHELG